MTFKREHQRRNEQQRSAERAAQLAAQRLTEAETAFEAVSLAVDCGDGTTADYWAARETRDVTAQTKRAADAWALRCQAIVDELLEAVR